jgi:hypothetical protein
VLWTDQAELNSSHNTPVSQPSDHEKSFNHLAYGLSHGAEQSSWECCSGWRNIGSSDDQALVLPGLCLFMRVELHKNYWHFTNTCRESATASE